MVLADELSKVSLRIPPRNDGRMVLGLEDVGQMSIVSSQVHSLSGRERLECHDAEGAGADYVHYRGIVVNRLQDRTYTFQLDQIPALRLIFHALQFVIEGKLLVAVKIGQAAPEFHSGRNALK